jgi:molybdopterin molybdotransferase
MHYEDALNLALSKIDKIENKIKIPLPQALNKILANDIKAIKNLPPFNNSAMDGYAIKHSEIKTPLKVVKTILAGNIQSPILKQNQCYKIMTGAKVPSDADTVVQKEFCKENNEYIEVIKEVKKGNAIRLKGEEIKKDDNLMQSGTFLNGANLALLASQGIYEIEVFKPLKIAILSSGSELKEPWQNANENELYNINAINLESHLKEFGFSATYLGLMPDNLKDLTKLLSTLENYDIIISSGGVSGGDADFTKQALLNNGFLEYFHGIKIKPGHPILVGELKNSLFIALPGNPLASIVNFLILAMPLILKKQGAKDIFFKTIDMKLNNNLNLKPNRVNAILGSINNNYFTPYNNNKYGSGMITPLTNSNALILTAPEVSTLNKEQFVKTILLNCKNFTNSFNYLTYQSK